MRDPDDSRGFVAEMERVEHASAVLSPLELEILVLSAGRQLPIADIAARLQINEARAERLLARALRKFDRALRETGKPWWRFW